MEKAKKIVARHNAKRGNRPNAVVLTTKAMQAIILSLRAAHRSTSEQRDYLEWIIAKLESQLPQETRNRPKKRRGK